MSAGLYNITLERGSTFSRVFQYVDALDTPIALTGARMQVRPSKDSNKVILDIAEGAGFTRNRDTATITLELDGATTLGKLNFSTAWYDIKASDSFGKPKRIVEGRVSISRQVTA